MVGLENRSDDAQMGREIRYVIPGVISEVVPLRCGRITTNTVWNAIKASGRKRHDKLANHLRFIREVVCIGPPGQMTDRGRDQSAAIRGRRPRIRQDGKTPMQRRNINLVAGLALCLALAPALGLPPSAHAQKAGPQAATVAAQDARNFVEARARELFSGSQKPDPAVLLALVDTPAIARFTLGREARVIAPADFQRYVKATESYLSAALSAQIGRFAGAKVQVLDALARTPQDAVVRTRITPKGGETVDLRWRVVRRGPEWKVLDLEAAGIWLAIQARAETQALLEQNGGNIDPVITRYEALGRKFAEEQAAARNP